MACIVPETCTRCRTTFYADFRAYASLCPACRETDRQTRLAISQARVDKVLGGNSYKRNDVERELMRYILIKNLTVNEESYWEMFASLAEGKTL